MAKKKITNFRNDVIHDKNRKHEAIYVEKKMISINHNDEKVLFFL